MGTLNKRMVLETLTATRLRELAEDLGVKGPRRAKEDLVEAFTRYRRIGTEAILERLTPDEFQAVAEAMDDGPDGAG